MKYYPFHFNQYMQLALWEGTDIYQASGVGEGSCE